MDNGNLDDILNGDEVAEAPEAVAETPPAAEPTQPRDDAGRFAPKGDTAPATEPAEQTAPPAVETQPQNIPPKALQEERRKRQEAEQRAAWYEQQFNQARQPQQPSQPAQAPDMWEDPKGYAEWVAAQAVERATAQVQGIGQQFVGATRFDVSEMIARSKFDDYDNKLAVFSDLARENPALVQRLQSEPDPAGFAYRYAKNHEDVQAIGSLDIEAIKAAAKAEALAELQAQQPAPVVPTTLADSQSAKLTATAPLAPPTLAQILGC